MVRIEEKRKILVKINHITWVLKNVSSINKEFIELYKTTVEKIRILSGSDEQIKHYLDQLPKFHKERSLFVYVASAIIFKILLLFFKFDTIVYRLMPLFLALPALYIYRELYLSRSFSKMKKATEIFEALKDFIKTSSPKVDLL